MLIRAKAGSVHCVMLPCACTHMQTHNSTTSVCSIVDVIIPDAVEHHKSYVRARWVHTAMSTHLCAITYATPYFAVIDVVHAQFSTGYSAGTMVRGAVSVVWNTAYIGVTSGGGWWMGSVTLY